MKKLLIIFCAVYAGLTLTAQTKKIAAFPITDYMIQLNDSVQVVQVQLPERMSIAMSAGCILKSVYSGTKDTVADLGIGKCNLIKAPYYYFTIRLKQVQRMPQKGDLLYAFVNLPDFYSGYLFDVVKHHITINSVEERKLLDMNMAISFKDSAAEQSVIDSLVNDVHYTAREMIAQQNNQDMTLQKGLFKGKKLFASMQVITDKEVIAFLKYINARPKIYAGGTWKFSEIFATWMSSGTPTVKE